MKKYIYIPIIGFIVSYLIGVFLQYSSVPNFPNIYSKDLFLIGLFGVVIAFIIDKSSKILNIYLPYKTNTGNRLFVGFLLHFIFSFFIIVLGLYIYNFLFFDTDFFFKKNTTLFIKVAIILLVASILFEVIYFALFSYYSYSKFQIETVKQERKQIELQLQALKSQLSPHFLFNNLNTISSLIFKDEHKAENFIRRLVKMYDFTLQSYHYKLISIEQELDFVRSYMYLLETRFKNKINFSFDINDDVLSTKVPPLTLQMLVENAVKHNQISTTNPLQISIKVVENKIVVENTINESPRNITSFNIGLKNINTRYLLITNTAISVIRGKSFVVKIPVIK